jgi:hypothetical protein
MQIDASGPAERYIQSRGGRIYVWFSPVGDSPWSVQRVAFRPPPGIDFAAHFTGSMEVHLQADFNPPEELRLRRRPWPLGPIDVRGTGAGNAWGDGGGGEGSGDWPTSHGGGDGGGGGHGGHGH